MPSPWELFLRATAFVVELERLCRDPHRPTLELGRARAKSPFSEDSEEEVFGDLVDGSDLGKVVGSCLEQIEAGQSIWL
jgi:hypothetical protein